MTEDQRKLYEIHKNDVLAWAEDFLNHFLTSKVPDFHREVYKDIQKEPRLALAAPRGFAKSFICSVIYPLHSALFQTRRDIVIISASENLAIEWLRKIRRELESNSLIIGSFGDMVSDKWTETHLILKNGVNIRARGAGGQIRGFRPDLIILDDIETDETVASEDQRNKLRDWIFKACLNTLVPDGQFIMIGTIISPFSLLAEILASDNDWVKRKYRAYIDGVQEKGRELWKDLWNHEKLQERKKEIGSTAFSAEFLNDPLSDESAPIQAKHIRYWGELPQQYSCVITLDPAYSEDERADYKIAAVVAIDNNQNRYLVDYIRTHKPTGEFIDAALNLYMRYKDTLTGFGVPAGGTEKEFFRSIQEKARNRGFSPPFVELKNVFYTQTGEAKKNKHSRITAALQPLFEQGKYYIGKNHEEAKEELLTYKVARHDDLVDAMAYAEQILTPVYFDMKQYQESVEDLEEVHRGDTGYGL